MRPTSKIQEFGLLLLLTITVLVYEWYWLSKASLISGSDLGNWLAFAHQLHGNFHRLAAGVYPPLFIELLSRLNELLPDLIALRVLGLMVFLVAIMGFVVAGRLVPITWPAILLVLPIYLTNYYHQDTMAFGGYPEMLAYGLFPVAMVLLYRALAGAGSIWQATTIILIVLLAATHHLTLVLFGLSACILFVLMCLRRDAAGRKAVWRRMVIIGVFTVLISLPILWTTYLPMLHMMVKQPIGNNAVPLILRPLSIPIALFRYNPLLGCLLIVTLLPLLWHYRKQIPSIDIGVSIFLAAFIMLIYPGEIRTRHSLILGISLVMVVVIENILTNVIPRDIPRDKKVYLAMAFLLPIGLITGNEVYQTNINYPVLLNIYTVLTPSVAEGLDWLRMNTPEDAVVAATRSNGGVLGWWVEGYGRRKSLYSINSKWLNFEDERGWTEIANTMFSPNVTFDDFEKAIYRSHANYLLIHQGYLASLDKPSLIWDGLDPWPREAYDMGSSHLKAVLQKAEREGFIRLVFRNDALLIYQTRIEQLPEPRTNASSFSYGMNCGPAASPPDT
jgi:hypothetical protein